MKAYFLAVFLSGCAALSAAQVQLAPNPGCPNNATYCRANVSAVGGLTPVVLGFNNGTLYGSVTVGSGTQCPSSGVSANSSPGTLCFYSATSFNPENWTYLGQYQLSSSERAAEIVFPSGSCSNYKYIYTLWGKEILRATSSANDWTFTDVGGSANLSGLPTDTGARPGSFASANQNGTTRLFYGNYNNHQNTCPQALLWHSDNCGSTWSSPYEFRLSGSTSVSSCTNPPYSSYPQYYHATEVHDVNVDPANNNNIYVTVDTETADAQPLGMWKSTDGGNSFTQLTSNSSAVGIDFVFPAGMNKIFLETDGCAGGVSPGCNWAGHLPTGSGPLMSQDEGADPFQIAATWPSVSSGPGWGGEAYSIKLTSDQSIFLLTDTEINGRQGVWYFTPPNYDNAALLEDLAPPINNLTWNNGTATATTINPHGFASNDVIAVSGVSNSCFDNSGVAITVTGSTTFTYANAQCTPCPNCSNPTGSGGLASKTGLDFFGRSTEARDPAKDVTYIFSAQERIARPIPQSELAVILQILYENLLN